MRGEVKDEAGNILQNVTIMQIRTGYIFRSGSLGTFGIGSNHSVDSFLFTQQGYYTERIALYADNFNYIKMRLLPASASNLHRDKLSSLTKDLDKDEQKTWYSGDETYASLLENHFIDARKFPITGMSLNVDRASYSNIRRFITLNSQVPPDAVRIEEMLNYFNLDYVEPAGNALFHCRTTLSSCPWNPSNQLYYVNLFSKKLNLDSLPPSNLVFLIDVSGSMDMPNRLPLLKSAFRLLVNNLREKDSVSIVVYGGVTGTMLNCTSGSEKEKILKVLDELEPGGSTPGESGIKMAYAMARRHFIKEGNNRVILATDGDFNVGLKTEDELDELISKEKETGIYLTCLGVGMGNYKDSKIQTLANKGNGNFAYLDNYKEAEKVLLKEFTQTLYAVANNVYMNVEFNPAYVKQYRLIGFDNKVGALRDSMSIVEGGEIGSGFSLIALFEIVPTEENKTAIKTFRSGDRFSEILLDYQKPENDKLVFHDHYAGKFEYTPPHILEKFYQFYSAVALFGSLLRNSAFVKEASWSDVIAIAEGCVGSNDLLQKEFIALVNQAKNLYSKSRKRKSSY
ncbi:MAG: von Willebrand factor type A domain-containing protein [Chitinophagaceae bacterium]|nr:von Willebrand factor type A domain-containing protein [Chitinophagaceae bacterium]